MKSTLQFVSLAGRQLRLEHVPHALEHRDLLGLLTPVGNRCPQLRDGGVENPFRVADPIFPQTAQRLGPRPGGDHLRPELFEDYPIRLLDRPIPAEIEQTQVPGGVADHQVVRLEGQQGDVPLMHLDGLGPQIRGELRIDPQVRVLPDPGLDPDQKILAAIGPTIEFHLEDPQLHPDLHDDPPLLELEQPYVQPLGIEGPFAKQGGEIVVQGVDSRVSHRFADPTMVTVVRAVTGLPLVDNERTRRIHQNFLTCCRLVGGEAETLHRE